MKKWLLVGLLGIPAAAVARPPLEVDRQQQQERGNWEPHREGATAGPVIGFDEGMGGAAEAGEPGQQGVQLSVDDAYKVEGRVAAVDPQNNEITLQRKAEEPNAVLKVANGARIERNGKQVGLSEFQPGDEVRARFDLAGDQPFAVELEGKGKK